MYFVTTKLTREIINGEGNVEETRAFQFKTVKVRLKRKRHPDTQMLAFEGPRRKATASACALETGR